MENNTTEQRKINISSALKNSIWAAKEALHATKFNYLVYFISRTFTVIQPYFGAFITGQILNNLVEIMSSGKPEITSNLMFLLAVMLFSYLIEEFSWTLYGISNLKFNYHWDMYSMSKFIEKNSKLDFQHVESADYSILMQKAKEAAEWRTSEVAKRFADFSAYLIGSIFVIGIFLTLNIFLIFLVLIPVVMKFFIEKKFGTDVYSFWDDQGDTKTHAWHARRAFESNDSLRESKIYGFASYIIKRYKETQQTFIDSMIKKVNNKLKWKTGVIFLDNTIFILVQFWLITEVIGGKLLIGNYSFYFNSLFSVSNTFNNIQSNFSGIMEYSPFVSDHREYLALPDIVEKPVNGIKTENKAPEIEFKNVSFKYPGSDKFVLKNVSFKILPGEKIALVGENGAGKSTIIKLMARFYDVTEGEILINGVNVKELDLQSYYKLWGVLFQSFAKLWFTIRENIGIGNVEDIDNVDLIKSAAEKSGADKFIEDLKDGYENYLTKDLKNGTELSGGQWQKIGIARSVFANPKFIVLDEPTSALDALAEMEVFRNINEIAKDTTILMVSHRFSTVRQADKIIVIKDGVVSEQGKHEDLMENKKLYFDMFMAQAEGYK